MVGIVLSNPIPKEEEIPNTVSGSISFSFPFFLYNMEPPQPPRSKRVGLSTTTGPPLSVNELKEQHGIKAVDYAYHSKLAPVPPLIHRQAQPSIDGESSQPRSRPLQRVPTEIIDENSQQSSQGYNNSRLLARNPNPLERSPHRIRYPQTTSQQITSPGPSSAAPRPPSAGQVTRPQYAPPSSPLRYTPDVPIENISIDHKCKPDDSFVRMNVDDDVRSTIYLRMPTPRLATPLTSPSPASAKIVGSVPTPPSTPPLKQLPLSRKNSLTKRPSLSSGSRSLIRRSSSSHVLTGHPPRYYLRKRKPPATATPIVASSSHEAKPKSSSRKRPVLRGGILKARPKKKHNKS